MFGYGLQVKAAYNARYGVLVGEPSPSRRGNSELVSPYAERPLFRNFPELDCYGSLGLSQSGAGTSTADVDKNYSGSRQSFVMTT